MIDGNGTAAPATQKQIVERAVARASRSWGGFRAWHQLEPEDRLALVECALKIPANDFADNLPVAL
jgi:hypothetical protein